MTVSLCPSPHIPVSESQGTILMYVHVNITSDDYFVHVVIRHYTQHILYFKLDAFFPAR